MNNLGEQYFPVNFIPTYIHNHPDFGVKRILTYTVFRFFSFAGKEDTSLAATLKDTLFPCNDTFDFSLIESYLSEDAVFTPAFAEEGYDAFFLYTAISIVEDFFDNTIVSDELSVVDNLIFSLYPVLSSVTLADDSVVAVAEGQLVALEDVKEEIIDSLVSEKKSEDKNISYVALDKMREESGLKFSDTVLEKKYNTYMSQYK